jgi:hypothetical protein
MDTTALVVIGLAVLLIVLVLLFARGGGRRHDLIALSNESRDRYLTEWDRIETRFVDAPGEAVSEADGLVIALLRERRHPLDSRRLPNELHLAREEASLRRGDKTEGMRRALLHYRAVIEKMVGMPVHGERDREGRREMA